jgi:hypothetical protein
MHALLSEINKGLDWGTAIRSVLGVSKESLYEKVGIYLDKEIN